MTMYQSLLMVLSLYLSVYSKAGARRSKCKPDCSLSKTCFNNMHSLPFIPLLLMLNLSHGY